MELFKWRNGSPKEIKEATPKKHGGEIVLKTEISEGENLEKILGENFDRNFRE
jgi:hypothetical protein